MLEFDIYPTIAMWPEYLACYVLKETWSAQKIESADVRFNFYELPLKILIGIYDIKHMYLWKILNWVTADEELLAVCPKIISS